MGRNTQAVIRFLNDLLFPPRCAVCEELMPPFASHGPVLCKTCGEAFEKACREAADTTRLSAKDGHVYLFHYRSGRTDGVPERLIYHLKHKGERRVFSFLARCLSSDIRVAVAYAVAGAPRESSVESEPEGHTSSGLPRPLYTYPTRRRKAISTDGFDQAKRLARELAAVGEGDFANCFCRRGAEREQKRLNATERLESATVGYSLRRGAVAQVRGRVVVVCDDLSTTGATLHATAHLLREAGARAVVLVSVARTEIAAPT